MDRFPRSDRRPSSIIGQTDMHWNGRTDRDKDIAKDILLGIHRVAKNTGSGRP